MEYNSEGMVSTSNIEVIESFQSNAFRMIVDTPSFVPNMVIGMDLQTPTVAEEVCRYSSH
jgi:hypothetical protein